MTTQIDGMADLQRRLVEIRKKSPKIAAAVLSAGLKVVAKEIESKTPGNLSDAKKTVGQKVDSQTGIAKVGYGVGRGWWYRPNKKKRVSGGVGISGNDVHWFVLGTGNRRTRKGGNRGKMSPMLQGVVAGAMQSAEGAAVEAMQAQLSIEMEKLNQ